MWKKQAMLALLICLTVVLLCGCAQNTTTYPEAGTAPTRQPVRQADVLQQPTEAPTPVIEFPDDYTEDEYDEYYEEDDDEETPAYSQVAVSRYAGATPIPIDPVDMPTPTPRPDIEFEYEAIDIKMGYSFEAPIGWQVDQDDASTFVISDPEARDGVNAVFTMTSQTVSSAYRATELKTELSNRLKDIQRNYVGWQIWQADKRQLLKSDGYYNAYRGVSYDGTVVRGLVHVALVDRKLIVLSYSAPGYYNNSYQRVYNRIRNTIE